MSKPPSADALLAEVGALLAAGEEPNSPAIHSRDPVLVNLLIWNVVIASVVNLGSQFLGDALLSALRRTRARLSRGESDDVDEAHEVVEEAVGVLHRHVDEPQAMRRSEATKAVRDILTASGQPAEAAAGRASEVVDLLITMLSSSRTNE